MRLIPFLIRFVLFILILAGLKSIWDNFSTGKFIPDWISGDDKTESVHTLMLQEMTAMGKLELVKYNFKDVVEQEVVKTWLPNAKAVVIVQGEAIGCVDLAKIEIADITSEQETLVVNMPEPELCVFKIDHEHSKVYNTEYAFTEEGKLVNEAFVQAEKQIRKSALDMGILDQTKENATKILTPMLEKASGKKVVLKFPMSTKIDKLR